MTLPNATYQQIEQNLAHWARYRPDVRAVVVIGSRARSARSADRWSDLELIVFVDDAALYENGNDWKDELAASLDCEVWFAAFNHTGQGEPEWEFVLKGGLKVDLVFCTNQTAHGEQASLAEMIVASPYRFIFSRGMRPLIDKTPLPALPAAFYSHALQSETYPLPDEKGLEHCVHNCLLEVVRAARMMQRGELWRAARVIHMGLHTHLLTLLEWHAMAVRGPGWSVWYEGRFLEEWADPALVALLPATFADNTHAGVKNALEHCLRVLQRVGPDLAKRLDLTYPADSVTRIVEWSQIIFEKNGDKQSMSTTRILHGERIGRLGRLRVGSSAVIFDESREKVLLTRRTDNGLWCLPAGGMDPGESAAETCAREVLEETGLAVTITHLIGIYTSPNWLIEYPDGSRVQVVAFCFEAEIAGGQMATSDEVSELGYFSLQEIDHLELMANHRQRILDAFEGQREAFIR